MMDTHIGEIGHEPRAHGPAELSLEGAPVLRTRSLEIPGDRIVRRLGLLLALRARSPDRTRSVRSSVDGLGIAGRKDARGDPIGLALQRIVNITEDVPGHDRGPPRRLRR